MNGFTICAPFWVLLRYSNQENEVGRAYSMHGREMHAVLSEILKERDYLHDSTDRRLIF
jgi:hypothetical protein